MSVLISCEVGGHVVPSQWSARLQSVAAVAPPDVVQSNPEFLSPATAKLRRSQRRPDRTAKYVSQQMAERLAAPLICNQYSPQLIDVRRSLRHRDLFSAATRHGTTAERQRLIEMIYQPYRQRLQHELQRMLSRCEYVIHLSVQSFPLGTGKRVRRADMGLLYDPGEMDEVDFCLDWMDLMFDELPMLRVRRNYPQRGTRDSITRAMRTEFRGQPYIGIELLVNQAWAGRSIAIRDEVIDGICRTLAEVLGVAQSKAA
jgi:hypothetical protein